MRDLNTSGTTRGTLVSIQIRVLLIAGIVAMIGYLATWLPFLMWKLNSWTRKVGSNGPYGVHSVALSPDGRTLAATSLDTLQIWDVPSGELRATILRPGEANFDPDCLEGAPLRIVHACLLSEWQAGGNRRRRGHCAVMGHRERSLHDGTAGAPGLGECCRLLP